MVPMNDIGLFFLIAFICFPAAATLIFCMTYLEQTLDPEDRRPPRFAAIRGWWDERRKPQ
jgi:hypothetical protein